RARGSPVCRLLGPGSEPLRAARAPAARPPRGAAGRARARARPRAGRPRPPAPAPRRAPPGTGTPPRGPCPSRSCSTAPPRSLRPQSSSDRAPAQRPHERASSASTPPRTVRPARRRPPAPPLERAAPRPPWPAPPRRASAARAPSPPAPCSRVDPPRVERGRNLANRTDQRRAAHRQMLLLGQSPDPVERVAQLVRKLGPDLLAVPEQPAEILHPLEVRDRNAACVREHVGQYRDPPLGKDLVGLDRRRPVGALGHEPALHSRRVLGGQLLLERRQNEDVARKLEQLGVRHVLDSGV